MRWQAASRVALAVLVSLALLVLTSRALLTIRDADISDFRCFWEAGRVAAAGLDPYDRAVWSLATRSEPGTFPPCDETFVYPGWTAFAFVPISVLPEQSALAIWEGALLASLVGAVVLLARLLSLRGSSALLLLVLASQPTYSAIANAQLGPILLIAAVALAYAVERRATALIAIAWWLLWLKPHVATLVLLAAPVMARSVAVARVMLLGGTAIIVASLMLLPAWPLEVVRELATQRRIADGGLASFWGLGTVLDAPAVLAPVAAVTVVIVLYLLRPRHMVRPVELLGLLIPASLLVTPYVRPHDHTLLVVSWAITMAAAQRARGARRARYGVALAGTALVLPWGVVAGASYGVPAASLVFVPLLSAIAAALALREAGEPMRARPSTPVLVA